MSIRFWLGAATVIAGLMWLGVLDNQRRIERVVSVGYETKASIVGAQHQYRSPLTFDGFSPRFVDERSSLNLKWVGRDGIERERQKVPVSDAFASQFVRVGQVRLIQVPVKVIDEDYAVPVVVGDLKERLRFIELSLNYFPVLTVVSGLGFVVAVARRRARLKSAAAK